MDKESTRKINELRKSLSASEGAELTDFDLHRYLCQFDSVDVAVKRIRRYIRVMKSWDIDSYKMNEVVEKYWTGGMLGLTGKDNNFVFIEALGCIDPDGLFRSCSFTNFMRTRMKMSQKFFQILQKHELESGMPSKFVLVLDFEHSKFDRHMFNFLIGHYRNYGDFYNSFYGNMFEKFIVVNAPKNAGHIYSLLRPFIPDAIKHKLFILNEDWRKKILDHINADALPVHWGGTMVDEYGDPKCGSRIYIPKTKVPFSYYWTPGHDNRYLQHLCVRRRDTECICVHIDRENVTLKWYFLTESKFAFGIYYTDNEEEMDEECMEMIFPDMGVYAAGTVVCEQDQIECTRIGYYKFRFDNRFSWVHCLNVHYKIELI